MASNTTTPKWIAELERLHGEAKLGTLKCVLSECDEGHEDARECSWSCLSQAASVEGLFTVDMNEYDAMSDAEAQYIVALHNHAPRLLAIAKAAKVAADEWRNVNASDADWHNTMRELCEALDASGVDDGGE